ncbi:MAG: flagellar basal body P-ring protein FlgI [Deltaproteobacteria bacterium]|nr:flagellar basal body P-ring protein FlgI [Deltaproteobacteria bacterium]
MKKAIWLVTLGLTVWAVCAPPAMAARVKDIAGIRGVRENKLIGYGLVIGLKNSGDGTTVDFTKTSIANLMGKFGITVDPSLIKVRNVAAVMVTADLPPFAKAGLRMDVMVSSLADATSLQGGTLLMTPLKGPDGEVYAVAQGPVSIGGFVVRATAGNVQANHPTAGKIPNGALVEKEVTFNLKGQLSFNIQLYEPDFSTATKLASLINRYIEPDIAAPVDATSVEVKVPAKFKEKAVNLLAQIEDLEITPESRAEVVVNERTGTVVVGADVRLATVAVSHGALNIQIKETPYVSQPNPLSGGRTVVTADSEITVKEDKRQLMVVPTGTTIGQLVQAMNAIGVGPRDLISIFQAIKAAGALHAELKII